MACTLCADIALAAPRRSAVALVTSGTDPVLLARIRGEMAALGWRVKTVPWGRDDALAQIAKRAHTLAVLRIGARANGIELWVAPEPDAEAHDEWIEIESERADLAVLRAVESLRARFLELGIEPEPARADESASEPAPEASEQPAPKPSTPPATPDRSLPLVEHDETARSAATARVQAPGVVFGVGAGALRATSGASLEAKLALAVRVLADPKFAASLEGWLPLHEITLSTGARSAGLRSSLFGATLGYRDHVGMLRWGASVGCALVWLRLRGNTSEGYLGVSKTLYVALPSARIHSELPLSRRLSLRLEATLGLARPRPVIQLGDVEDYWGQPLVAATLGAEWAPFAK